MKRALDGENSEREGIRRRITHACRQCRVMHRSCDSQIPCSRCVERGIGDACTYDQRRKRGPPARLRTVAGPELSSQVSSLSSSEDSSVGQLPALQSVLSISKEIPPTLEEQVDALVLLTELHRDLDAFIARQMETIHLTEVEKQIDQARLDAVLQSWIAYVDSVWCPAWITIPTDDKIVKFNPHIQKMLDVSSIYIDNPVRSPYDLFDERSFPHMINQFMRFSRELSLNQIRMPVRFRKITGIPRDAFVVAQIVRDAYSIPRYCLGLFVDFDETVILRHLSGNKAQ